MRALSLWIACFVGWVEPTRAVAFTVKPSAGGETSDSSGPGAKGAEAPDPEAALVQLNEYLESHGEDVEALLQRSRVLSSLGRYVEAEQDLLRCVDLSPDEPALQLVLGILYHQWGQYQKARQCFDNSAVISADDGLLLNFLGNLELSAGRLRSARHYFDRARTVLPGSPVPRMSLAMLEWRLGHGVKAVRQLRELCHDFPDFAQGKLGLAEVLLGLNCPDLACNHLRELVQLSGEEYQELRAQAFRLLGWIYDAAETLEPAIACFEGAILEGDTPLPIFDDLALLYEKVGREEDAIGLLRLAIQLDGRAVDRLHLSRIFERLGRHDEALGQLRDAFEGGARDPAVLGALCRLEERAGNPSLAQDAFAELLRAGEQYPGLASHVDFLVTVAERSLSSKLTGVASTQRGERSLQSLEAAAARAEEHDRARIEAAVKAAGLPPRSP